MGMNGLLLPAILFLCSLLYLVCAVLVGWRRKYHPRAAWGLLIYALLSFSLSLFLALRYMGWLHVMVSTPLASYEGILGRIEAYGLFILAFNLLLITRTLLRINGGYWIWLALGIVWAAALVVLDINLLLLPDLLLFRGGLAILRQKLVYGVFLSGWAVFMGSACSMAIWSLRHNIRFYTAISYWALVLFLTVLGDGLFFSKNYASGIALHLAGTLMAVYVVSLPRLPNVSHLFRRSLSFVMFGGAAVVLYTICLIIAQLLLRNNRAISPLLAGLAMAVFLVAFFNPLLNGIRRVIQWWITGEDVDPTELLRQYSQSITNILDLNLLATVAVGTASDLLDVNRGFLFLVDFEKGADGRNYYQLRGVKGMGASNPLPGMLGEDSPLSAFFRLEYAPLTQSEIDFMPRFRNLQEAERKWTNSLGAEVYVPIHTKNDWIGLLCLGPKASGAAFTDQDLALLSTMADQTAVALENTRLVEGLVRLNNDFRRAYTALDQANRNLERLDRTKSDFISIASHELRTPLTLISGSSQMLLDDPSLQENSYYQQLLNKINIGTVRLHEIVDSMLDIAKIDTRALELDTQPVILKDVIGSVCSELKKSYSERKQTLDIQDLKSLPSVHADPDSLRKVFYHLVVNAIKYTPDGGKITISGLVASPSLPDLPEGGVEVVISDTGIGIDPRYQELIFTKFYQTGELALHSSGKTKFKGGGPGLGLAIARGIVEAHNGKIWVESSGYDEENCPGSKFHVLLPLGQIHSSSEKKISPLEMLGD